MTEYPDRPPKPAPVTASGKTTERPVQNIGHKNIEPYKFKPGQSGNPGGRPKSTSAMKERAASMTDDALDVLAGLLEIDRLLVSTALDMARDQTIPAETRIAALTAAKQVKADNAREVLDRGHGKSQTNVAVTTNSPFDNLTEDETEEYVQNAALELLELKKQRMEMENGQRARKTGSDASRKGKGSGPAGGSRT